MRRGTFREVFPGRIVRIQNATGKPIFPPGKWFFVVAIDSTSGWWGRDGVYKQHWLLDLEEPRRVVYWIQSPEREVDLPNPEDLPKDLKIRPEDLIEEWK